MVFLVAEKAWWKRCKGGLGHGEEKRLVGLCMAGGVVQQVEAWLGCVGMQAWYKMIHAWLF